MVKTEISKFISDIKLELLNYEEISDSDAKIWESTFLQLFKDKKVSEKNITRDKGLVYFCVHDEMEIFAIVDDYVNAILDNDLKTYWNSFK